MKKNWIKIEKKNMRIKMTGYETVKKNAELLCADK